MDFFGIGHIDKKYVMAIVATVVIVFSTLFYFADWWGQSVLNDTKNLSEEEKMDILNALAENSPPPPSVADRREIVNGLAKQNTAGYQYSEEGKLQVLRQLEANSKN